MRKYINENLNYARSILRKSGIDPTNEDFLKIREMSKDKPGYLGLLTKLHFIDNVQLDELSDIFLSLVDMNINVNDVLNMDYVKLSDYLIDKKSITKDNNYKLQFTDGVYNYYQVFNYAGILEIGSPAWCIKTKSNFDSYTSNDVKKNQQWVVIKNINKRLLSPNTNYLSKYSNTSNPNIRFGVTLNVDMAAIGHTYKVYCFDDNDGTVSQASGSKGHEIVQNIIDFNNGKTIEFSFEKLLNKEPVVVFDKNKKLFEVDDKEMDIVNIHMGFDINWISGGKEHPTFLFTIDDKFSRYITISGYWITVCDGKEEDRCPNLNQKVFYEICKLRKLSPASVKGSKGKWIPTPLYPISINLGISSLETWQKNEHCYVTNNKGRTYLTAVYANKKGEIIIDFVDMDTSKYYDLSNFFICYKKKSTNYLDIDFFYDSDIKKRNLTDENLKLVMDKYGEENIERYFNTMYEYLKKDKEENSISGKIKNWMRFNKNET